ncbi:MAG: hypothetical protein RI950_1296 [Bacteroidota bacterium]
MPKCVPVSSRFYPQTWLFWGSPVADTPDRFCKGMFEKCGQRVESLEIMCKFGKILLKKRNYYDARQKGGRDYSGPFRVFSLSWKTASRSRRKADDSANV